MEPDQSGLSTYLQSIRVTFISFQCSLLNYILNDCGNMWVGSAVMRDALVCFILSDLGHLMSKKRTFSRNFRLAPLDR